MDPTFEELHRRDVKDRPYEVWHPEAQVASPTFKTLAEARVKAKQWNLALPGHRARRRK